MGPQRDRYTALLALKDEEISRLELLAQAHTARSAHLQTRLLATLDILDTVRAEAASDVAALRASQAALSAKLMSSREAARSAEAERNDLQDAVQKLVHRVEANHDFASWPCQRMRCTALVEPIKVEGATHTTAESNLFTFASHQISSLRMERDAERHAHTLTKQRVIELEAAVARRDAELDACVAGHTHTHTACPSSSSTAKRSRTQPEHVVAFLDVNFVNNRALEDEVRALSQQLEREKRRQRQRPTDSPTPSTSTPLSEPDVPSPTLTEMPVPRNDVLTSKVDSRKDAHRTKMSALSDMQRMIDSFASAIDGFALERQQLGKASRQRKSRSPTRHRRPTTPRPSSPTPPSSPTRLASHAHRSSPERSSSPIRSTTPTRHRRSPSVNRSASPTRLPSSQRGSSSHSDSTQRLLTSSNVTVQPTGQGSRTSREGSPRRSAFSQERKRQQMSDSGDPTRTQSKLASDNVKLSPEPNSSPRSPKKDPLSPDKAPPEYQADGAHSDLNRIPDLTADLINLREELDSVRNDLASARGKLAPALRELGDVRDDLERVEKDLERAKRDGGRAKAESETARQEAEKTRRELSAVRVDLERVQGELERVLTDNSRLIIDLERANTQNQRLPEDHGRLAAQLESQHRDGERIRRDLERASDEAQHFATENHRLTAENERLREVLGRDSADEVLLGMSEGEASRRGDRQNGGSSHSRSTSGSGSSLSLTSRGVADALLASEGIRRVAALGGEHDAHPTGHEEDGAVLGSRGFRTPSPPPTWRSESSTGRHSLPMRRPSSSGGRPAASGSRRSSLRDRPPTPARPSLAPSPATSPVVTAEVRPSHARTSSASRITPSSRAMSSFAHAATSFAPSTAHPTPSFAHVLASTPPPSNVSQPSLLSSPISLHPLHPTTPIHIASASIARSRSNSDQCNNRTPPTREGSAEPYASLSSRHLPPAPPSTPPNFLDEEDGEMSMELATPLLPTTMLVSELDLPTIEVGGGDVPGGIGSSTSSRDSLGSVEPLDLPPSLRPRAGSR